MMDINITSNTSIPMNTTTYILHEQCEKEVDAYYELKLFNFVFTVLIAAFGLISNNIVIAVNRSIPKLSSTDVYITFLAVSDNLLIISISLYAYRYVYPHLLPAVSDWTISGIATFIGLLFEHFTQFLNTYLIVLLSLDRYIQVKHIAFSKSWCTPRRALINMSVITASAIVFTLPRLWEYISLIQHADESINKCKGYFIFTHGIGADPNYRLAYGFVLYIIVMYCIPLLTLAKTNYTLIKTIWKRRLWLNRIQTDSSSREREQMKKTELSAIVTLVIVTVTFMILQIPDMSLQFIWRLSPQHGPTASIFSFQLMIINSSVNFIIYAISSSVFRKRLIILFSCCLCRNKTLPSSVEGTVLGEIDHRSSVMISSTDTNKRGTVTTHMAD